MMMETAGFSGMPVPVHTLHSAVSQKTEIFFTAELLAKVLQIY
jgi:hypothetical protein